MSSRILPRLLSAALVVALLGTSVPAPVSARIIGSEESLAAPGAEADRGVLSAWLARAEVREELLALGVDPAEVEARVAALGDEEVASLAGQIDEQPAGGSVVGVLFTVFIVLLVTDILGFTRVFPFTRSIR